MTIVWQVARKEHDAQPCVVPAQPLLSFTCGVYAECVRGPKVEDDYSHPHITIISTVGCSGSVAALSRASLRPDTLATNFSVSLTLVEPPRSWIEPQACGTAFPIWHFLSSL